jgi:hypothetical protein
MTEDRVDVLGRARHRARVGEILHPVDELGDTVDLGADEVGELGATSSHGPTRDGRQKPDLIAPGQFVALVALMQLSENLQHANVRLSFGKLGERLWVSPRFHRLHHSIGEGHESVQAGSGRVVLGGHNFGVLLPWWDMLLGTANFEARYGPTGVRDQVEQGRRYGAGFWSQQWLGLQRLRNRA